MMSLQIGAKHAFPAFFRKISGDAVTKRRETLSERTIRVFSLIREWNCTRNSSRALFKGRLCIKGDAHAGLLGKGGSIAGPTRNWRVVRRASPAMRFDLLKRQTNKRVSRSGGPQINWCEVVRAGVPVLEKLIGQIWFGLGSRKSLLRKLSESPETARKVN